MFRRVEPDYVYLWLPTPCSTGQKSYIRALNNDVFRDEEFMTLTAAELQKNSADNRYRMLVDAITDYAIYMLDETGLVTSWNAGAKRFKGYSEAEILGEHFSRFYTPEDRDAGIPAKALLTAKSVGRFEAEGWRVRKDGERFWAHVVIDAIKDATAGW